jgi:uncharacterized protein (TIGR02391 family)
MTLETAIDQRLWNVIRTSYEAKNFTSGIREAIQLLTDVIRDRTGLESDGVALVGQALGGVAPRLKVSKLQTETDQSIQEGTQALLRGLYQAIRNPRSHEAYKDTEKDATALILFVDYFLRIVDKSGTPAEIPVKKRLAVCREVFAKWESTDSQKVKYFYRSIFKELSQDEKEEFIATVSAELRETRDEDAIRYILEALPISEMWHLVDPVGRMRIENKLIQSVTA